jgi:hypothetical protein
MDLIGNMWCQPITQFEGYHSTRYNSTGHDLIKEETP